MSTRPTVGRVVGGRCLLAAELIVFYGPLPAHHLLPRHRKIRLITPVAPDRDVPTDRPVPRSPEHEVVVRSPGAGRHRHVVPPLADSPWWRSCRTTASTWITATALPTGRARGGCASPVSDAELAVDRPNVALQRVDGDSASARPRGVLAIGQDRPPHFLESSPSPIRTGSHSDRPLQSKVDPTTTPIPTLVRARRPPGT